jgi:predicted small integral membrane protein
MIIGTEIIIALLCWMGGFRLFKAIDKAIAFNHSKKMAITGLTLGFLLWFIGFMAIGGEWFLMWQSEVANAQQAAFRLVVIIAIILIYLIQPDDEKYI